MDGIGIKMGINVPVFLIPLSGFYAHRPRALAWRLLPGGSCLL